MPMQAAELCLEPPSAYPEASMFGIRPVRPNTPATGAACYQCGSPSWEPHGYFVLCGSCRMERMLPTVSNEPIRSWTTEELILSTCWRCPAKVNPKDELGLCPKCIGELRA